MAVSCLFSAHALDQLTLAWRSLLHYTVRGTPDVRAYLVSREYRTQAAFMLALLRCSSADCPTTPLKCLKLALLANNWNRLFTNYFFASNNSNT